jgi:4-diphosphocytidyl-2-C-methyl-D-erythritol kinase
MSLVLNSPCKTNLVLNILGKRPDGYHELETVMLPVPLYDRLRFSRDGTGLSLTCSDPALPVDERNLVHKAATAFFAAIQRSPEAQIHLDKFIPMAAGLGGGSGNAATTLLGLNELFGQPLSPSQLNSIAARLGSDIPFFLQSAPALATGRGEIIEPLAPFAALADWHVILVHPGFGISTPWAYQQLGRFPSALNGKRGRAADFVQRLSRDSIDALRFLYNSLEAPALEKFPLLRLFQEFFRAEGLAGTLMSGSGSSTFALAPDQSTAARVVTKFQTHFGSSLWIRTVALSA